MTIEGVMTRKNTLVFNQMRVAKIELDFEDIFTLLLWFYLKNVSLHSFLVLQKN